MAVRKNLVQNKRTREKIQATQIVNRLTGHVMGEVEMSASQVTAALGLLKKTIPDLQAVSMDVAATLENPKELSADEKRQFLDGFIKAVTSGSE